MSIPLDPNALTGMMSGFQQQMEQMKAEAGKAEVEGKAGGGLVTVRANGNLDVLGVTISEDAMDDREMLEDLVTAATNDAIRKAQQILQNNVGQMLGGLPLPPGLLGG